MPQAQPELKKVHPPSNHLHLYRKQPQLTTSPSTVPRQARRSATQWLATESKPNNEKVRLGMCVIRGNAVVMLEALDRIDSGERHRG
jgi:small nuclear ribonucleoprotein G